MLINTIKIIALNIVFLTIFNNVFAEKLIIPKKKPLLSKELIEEKIIKGQIIPQKKPQIQVNEILDEEIIKKKEKIITKINGVIIPKSKPLIVKKQKKRIAKGKYFKERDLKYAKQAIGFMEKSNWRDAIKVSKKAKDKSIYDF